MNLIEKAKKKRELKRKLKDIYYNTLKYLIGYPLHFLIFKPLEQVSKLKDWHYSKRFDYIEKKAMGEMQQYLLNELAFYGCCGIAYEVDDDYRSNLSVEHFLRNGFWNYRKKGRKYSMLYGKLFSKKVKENQLKYTNELVLWLLDQGLEVKLQDYYGHHGGRKQMLVAKVEK